MVMEIKKPDLSAVKRIVACELKDAAILRRWHLNRDVVTGCIGERGSGKSLSAATMAFTDHMVHGEPCWSNMHISVSVVVDEATFQKYEAMTGLKIKREPAVYESQELDFNRLLSFAPEYQNGVFLIDEINIALADARRAMTNQALAASDFIQQLRKLQSALIFTCINEMFVENRIREATDCFIQMRDTAFLGQNMAMHKKQGVDFEWRLYPMTGKLFGYDAVYAKTQKVHSTVYLHGKPLWGIMDTYERQKREKYKSSTPVKEVPLPTITESPVIVAERDEWGWLANVAEALLNSGEKLVPCADVMAWPEVRGAGISQFELSRQLRAKYNIPTKTAYENGIRGQSYVLDKEILPHYFTTTMPALA